ncbi:Aspartate racemase [Bienertia sinuspersici]
MMYNGTMSMSFHRLNYPAHVLGKNYNHGTLKWTRIIPALATTRSSDFVHTNESENALKCGRNYVPNMSLPNKASSTNSMLNQANTIGIIGGVSADSTLNFLHKLVKWGSKEGNVWLPFMLCSDPQLTEELLIYERSYFPSLYTRIRPSNLDHTKIVANLNCKRVFLEQGGARCLVMPCNLLHCWHDDVSKECSVSILHMGECVAKELKEAKLRPLETGSPLRIGVVATDAVLKSGFYQEKLQNEGFEVVLPDKATMEHTIRPAIEALDRKDIEGARTLLRIALQVLLVRAVNMVIIASHDMLELLPPDDPLLKKCVDPIDALVRSTIRWAQSVERGSY